MVQKQWVSHQMTVCTYSPKRFLGLLFLFISLNFLNFSAHGAPSQLSESSTSQVQKSNGLKNHSSPYLAMHSQDPLNWLDWSSQALKRAQQQNKPILISSGYFACHWCHVMQKENYQDPVAAQLMDQHFISVKLDRELEPDLDQYLIEFSRNLTGQAGWPQHVVLTPQGYPFSAFGYLPNANFINTLNQLNTQWQTQPDTITRLAKKAAEPLELKRTTPIRPAEFKGLLLQAIDTQMDDFSGGLKGTNKFPESPVLLSLLTLKMLPENQQAWLTLTLEQMQNQHLQDHIQGGFYRYTVDPEWQIPHFEKMGYDNAQLAQIYFLAGQKLNRQDFTNTALQTLTYMEQHLFNPKLGLFASSQSALDKQGIEGGDYLFSRVELQNQLSKPAFKVVEESWQLNRPAPYDIGWHPKPTDQYWPEIKQALQTPIAVIPVDEKHIISWNGLALSAYVSAFESTQNMVFLNKALALAQRLTDQLNSQQPPRALDINGEKIGLATLEDFAYVINGLQKLHQVQPTEQRAIDIKNLNTKVHTLFLNASGWQANQQALLPGQNRLPALIDDAIPSASALMECATPKAGLSRNPFYAKALRDEPLNYASYLSVLNCQRE